MTDGSGVRIREAPALQREVHDPLTATQPAPVMLDGMREMLSCRHCKRAVLIGERITLTDVVELVRHLATCAPDDPFDSTLVEDSLRHFRRVAIEGEEGPNRDAAIPAGR